MVRTVQQRNGRSSGKHFLWLVRSNMGGMDSKNAVFLCWRSSNIEKLKMLQELGRRMHRRKLQIKKYIIFTSKNGFRLNGQVRLCVVRQHFRGCRG